VSDAALQRRESFVQGKGEVIFEIAPEPLDGIKFRAVRGQRHEPEIGG